ncbi:MAG: phospholipid carrier-dependent glycosyltransferase [Candidatus Electrothrix sp. ATG1]|nr:phospholipid carrier-dependent glycosyltransferase [Candidatus Electrothrix sp. ATG1]
MHCTSSKKQGLSSIIRVLLAGLLVALALLACTPPFSRDALIHHLQIPKLYLLHGGIYQIPELPFSYYPMNLDLLYMGALSLGSDILAKYIHMAFGLATALLLYFHLKKRLSSMYGLLGALFFLSIPIIVKLSITVYVDLGLLFFSTSSLLLLFHWLETGKQKKHLLLAGLSCGLAIGTKYNGLLVLFLCFIH